MRWQCHTLWALTWDGELAQPHCGCSQVRGGKEMLGRKKPDLRGEICTALHVHYCWGERWRAGGMERRRNSERGKEKRGEKRESWRHEQQETPQK